MFMLDLLHDEFLRGLPDATSFARALLRLSTAMLLGAAVGYERERAGKAAGLRTHMLVSMGAALFVMLPPASSPDPAELSRVVQGIATGIGFIGTGAILKRDDRGGVQGLTTAAGIWLTAAVGVAAGTGQLGVAVLGVGLTLLTLALVARLERRVPPDQEPGATP